MYWKNSRSLLVAPSRSWVLSNRTYGPVQPTEEGATANGSDTRARSDRELQIWRHGFQPIFDLEQQLEQAISRAGIGEYEAMRSRPMVAMASSTRTDRMQMGFSPPFVPFSRVSSSCRGPKPSSVTVHPRMASEKLKSRWAYNWRPADQSLRLWRLIGESVRRTGNER